MCLTIKDVLTRKVLTISPDICLAEAAQMMSAHRISCLVAVESDRPVGIITEADLVQVAHSHLDLEPSKYCWNARCATWLWCIRMVGWKDC